MWSNRPIAYAFVTLLVIAGCGGEVERDKRAVEIAPPQEPRATHDAKHEVKAESVSRLNRDTPERVFRRGETRLPLSRRFVNRAGQVLSVEVQAAEDGLALRASVDGEAIYQVKDGVEKVEEIYVGELIADGPGGLLIISRRDCKFLRFRMITYQEGLWQVVIESEEMSNGFVEVRRNHFTGLEPARDGYNVRHFTYGYSPLGAGGVRDWVPAWNDHYSTWVRASEGETLPEIPDCPRQ